jgi:hypothetical protein
MKKSNKSSADNRMNRPYNIGDKFRLLGAPVLN